MQQDLSILSFRLWNLHATGFKRPAEAEFAWQEGRYSGHLKDISCFEIVCMVIRINNCRASNEPRKSGQRIHKHVLETASLGNLATMSPLVHMSFRMSAGRAITFLSCTVLCMSLMSGLKSLTTIAFWVSAILITSAKQAATQNAMLEHEWMHVGPQNPRRVMRRAVITTFKGNSAYARDMSMLLWKFRLSFCTRELSGFFLTRGGEHTSLRPHRKVLWNP